MSSISKIIFSNRKKTRQIQIQQLTSRSQSHHFLKKREIFISDPHSKTYKHLSKQVKQSLTKGLVTIAFLLFYKALKVVHNSTIFQMHYWMRLNALRARLYSTQKETGFNHNHINTILYRLSSLVIMQTQFWNFSFPKYSNIKFETTHSAYNHL